MLQSEYRQSRRIKRAATTAFALVLGVSVFTGYAASSPEPGGSPPAGAKKEHVYTQVYQHAYDEVFQAIQVWSERHGHFVTDKDENKGTISVDTGTRSHPVIYDIHVEALNTKPETQVTVVFKFKVSLLGNYTGFADDFFRQLQQVLSTYR